jgi:hypothetical protein
MSGDYWLDISGDNVVSRLDADQVTSKINTGNGNITTAWRNGTNPSDVNGDGTVNAAGVTAIYDLLEIDHTLLEDLGLDAK